MKHGLYGILKARFLLDEDAIKNWRFIVFIIGLAIVMIANTQRYEQKVFRIAELNNEVKEFLLLPDQMSCCFGQAPEANGWVVVSATKGVEVMMDRIIRVTGGFAVEERWDEEFFVGLYHMTCNEITGPAL